MGRDSKGRFTKGNTAAEKVQRSDEYQSNSTGFGVEGMDKRQTVGYCSDVIGYATEVELMKGDDIAQKAVCKITDDALAPGFDVTINGVDNAKDLQEALEQRWVDLDADDQIRTAKKYERAYGGAAIMIGANDGQDIRSPLNPDAVSSVDYLTVFEPREFSPLWYYDDPHAPNFRKPAIFQVSPNTSGPNDTGSLGNIPFEIHESRLIYFGGIRVNTDPQYLGHGSSVLNSLWHILRDFSVAWASASVLMTDFSQSVLKIKGLAEWAVTDNTGAFINRLRDMEVARSTIRATVIDADEEYERKATPMSGFPEMLDRFESRVAAALSMPITVLFGRSPGGMNSTGESDLQNWRESVSTYRNREIIPAYKKLTASLIAEAGIDADQWSITGRPLKAETAAEQAATRKLHAETGAILISSGVIYPEELAESMFGGDVYSPEVVIDFDERAKLEAEADLQQAEEDAKALELAEASTPNTEEQTAQPEGDADATPDKGGES